ncbi:hypothetical protein WG66_004471 [Moniliophthora roreri]|nr:hypothetical protein WG66_004471 [Moniliophthora roreri]
MPPETTAKSSRRREKKLTVEEMKDIEQKRLRGRIRALEDALAIMQAAVSNERHPLLGDELLKIKFGAETLGEGKSTRSRSEEVTSPVDEVGEGSGTPGGSGGNNTRAGEKVDTTALDTLGTLTLDEEGELKYFGRSAGKYLEEDGTSSESGLNMDPQIASTPNPSETVTSTTTAALSAVHTSTSDIPDALPPEIYALAAGNFGTNGLSPGSPQTSLNANSPESSQGGQDTLQSLLTHLPPRDRGKSLAQSYIDHAAMFFRPLTKDDLLGDPTIPDEGVLGQIYTSRDSSTSTPTSHLLSATFFVFALGAFFDLSLKNGKYIQESEAWFSLGMRAMILGSDSTHMTNSAEDTVRALGLMATYITMTGRKYSRDSAWSGVSLAVKVAQGAGFHRDPARWGMDPRTVQKRRALWWEVFSADVSHSLALGRPPSVHLSFTDVEFPLDEDATLKTVSSGEASEEVIVDGFWRTKHKFSRDCFMQVINATLTAKAPNYATVLDLDRQVRECGLPSGFKPYVSIEEDGEEVYRSSGLALRDFYTSQFRTVTMLYLHRSFFAHAMLTFPSNPFLSPFAPSFLAAYRGASIIVKAAVHMFDRCAEMAGRVWFLMYHVFSAAVVLGTVVTRSPNSTLAPSALMDIKLAVDLFEKCSSTSKRNKVAFLVLKRLKDKAVKSYEGFCKERDQSKSAATSPESQPTPQDLSPSPGQLDPNLFSPTPTTKHSHDSDVEDELELFGGQTRVLRAKKGTKIKKRKSPSVDSAGGGGGAENVSTSPATSTILASGPSEPSSAMDASAISEERPSAPVSQDTPTPLQPTATNDIDLDFGMGMDLTGTGFDAAMGFGFGAGTTGTAMGGLNVASMDTDMDLGFDFASATEDFVQGSSSNSILPPGEKVHPSLLHYLNGGGMAEEPLMNWVPNQDANTPMSFPWGEAQGVGGGGGGGSGIQARMGYDPNASGLGTWGGGQNLQSQPQMPHSMGSQSSGPTNGADKTEDERRLSELYSSFMDFLAQRHSRPHNDGIGTFSRPGFSNGGLGGLSSWNPSSSFPSMGVSQNKPFNHDHWSHLPPSSFERDFSFLAQTKGLRSFGKAQVQPPFGSPGMGFGSSLSTNPNRSALEDEFLSFMRRHVHSNGASNHNNSGDNQM